MGVLSYFLELNPELNLHRLSCIYSDLDMNTVDKHTLLVGRLREGGHTEGTLSLSPVFEPGLCDINTCVFKTNCYCVCAQSCPTLFATSWTVSHQAPLSGGTLQARILE